MTTLENEAGDQRRYVSSQVSDKGYGIASRTRHSIRERSAVYPDSVNAKPDREEARGFGNPFIEEAIQTYGWRRANVRASRARTQCRQRHLKATGTARKSCGHLGPKRLHELDRHRHCRVPILAAERVLAEIRPRSSFLFPFRFAGNGHPRVTRRRSGATSPFERIPVSRACSESPSRGRSGIL